MMMFGFGILVGVIGTVVTLNAFRSIKVRKAIRNRIFYFANLR